MIDGRILHFGVPGIANGLAVLRDEETNSLWDHITGECFAGALAGRRLAFWPVHLTTAGAELAAHPETILLPSGQRPLLQRLLDWVMGKRGLIQRENGLLPPHFRLSMSRKIDPRRPEVEQGFGIIDDQNRGKYYPLAALPRGEAVHDVWHGRPLTIVRSETDGVPLAAWNDTGEPPMQLLTRWYGFAFTYPDCEIYEPAGRLHPASGGT